MKIFFTSQGGFGIFPGLNKPLEINSDKLPLAEAEELEKLVIESDFFNTLPKDRSLAKGNDLYEYTIRVEHNDKHHTITLSDSNPNLKLQPLLNYLKKKQKEARR